MELRSGLIVRLSEKEYDLDKSLDELKSELILEINDAADAWLLSQMDSLSKEDPRFDESIFTYGEIGLCKIWQLKKLAWACEFTLISQELHAL